MKKYMNIAKLTLLVMAFLGAASCAIAQTENPEMVSVETITIAPGEEVEVAVNYECALERSGFQMHILLPIGLDFVEQTGVDEDGDPITFYVSKGSACKANHKVAIGEFYKGNSKDLLVLVDNPDIKALNSPGSLISFKVKADESLAETSQIVLKDVKFNGGQYFDVNANVVRGPVTGISGAMVDNTDNIPAYNLAGQMISRSGKTIIVKKGKKYIQNR